MKIFDPSIGERVCGSVTIGPRPGGSSTITLPQSRSRFLEQVCNTRPIEKGVSVVGL